MEDYKYSIIIPHRNIPTLLQRAINSVPQREDIEIIVVDNSDTIVDLNTVKKSHLNTIVIFSSPLRGAGGARNEGLKIARGKWLLFLDADDFFTENAFDCFDRYSDLNYDIVFYKWTSCDSETLQYRDRDSVYNKLLSMYLSNPNKYEYLIRYRLDSPCGKIVLRDLVQKYNITFDEVIACNDALFSTKSGFYASKVYAVDDVVYCATIRIGSITKTDDYTHFKSRYLSYLKINRFLLDNKVHYATRPIIRYIIYSIKYGLHSFFYFVGIAIKLNVPIFVGIGHKIK